jgi:exopolysaccharide biosynthesis polyprenyl glycosylphosphotransferase
VAPHQYVGAGGALLPTQAAAGVPALHEVIDDRTLQILARRQRTAIIRRRGWLVHRALLAADIVGLSAAFAVGELLVPGASQALAPWSEVVVFVAILPLWVVGAKLFGLFDRDEERTDHSTVDDLTRVLLLVTLGAFLLTQLGTLTSLPQPDQSRITVFWATAIGFVVLARIGARIAARRSITYLQNTVIVGAGEIGQLIARKLLQHREYGINLIGFVDADPIDRVAGLDHLAVIGPPEWLPDIVRTLDVERVIVAFSKDSHRELLRMIRPLSELGVQIDIVPRLFEVVGPRVAIHTIEGVPLVGLPPVRLNPSSRLTKRAIDLVGAATLLILAAPLFLLIALRIKLDSPGPVLFKQTRLGIGMRQFTALKFRTMYVGTPDEDHREFVRASMDHSIPPLPNGLYKLERTGAITPFGRWLRRTSLDELPQLLNVLRGDMSLVGPRPCLPYETENFAPHHFERFAVPAGITGLWQVTARARSTFGEALDLDVSYARGWSLGLDLRLLCRTPVEILHPSGTR